jgi:hypothetical protein
MIVFRKFKPNVKLLLPQVNCIQIFAFCRLPFSLLPTAHCPLPFVFCRLPAKNCREIAVLAKYYRQSRRSGAGIEKICTFHRSWTVIIDIQLTL